MSAASRSASSTVSHGLSGVARFVRLFEEGVLYALLFLLPFSIAAIEITFGLLLMAWILQRINPITRHQTIWRSPQLRPLLLAAGGFLLACALSIPGSDFPRQSVTGFINKWLEYVLFAMIVADLGARLAPKRAIAVIACSSVFVIIEAVTQEMFRYGVFRHYPLGFYGRMTGPYQNPSDLATYLMVVIPLLLSSLISWNASSSPERLWRRLLTGGRLLMTSVLLGALLLCLARTESLGAWLGLLGGLLMMLVTTTVSRRATLIVLLAMSVSAIAALHHTRRLQTVISTSEIGKLDRLAMWKSAVHMIRDRPLVGHGLNTFMANYLRYWVAGERQPRYAHNCYLQVAAETGFVGLAAFLVWLWQLFRPMFLALSSRRLTSAHSLLAGLTAGLLAFALQAAVDTNFYSVRQSGLFWALAGLAIGWSQRLLVVHSP